MPERAQGFLPGSRRAQAARWRLHDTYEVVNHKRRIRGMSPSSAIHIPSAANRERTRGLLRRGLTHGGFRAFSGDSARQLVWLDEYANDEGLEIRDPGGFLANHDEFLAIVHSH